MVKKALKKVYIYLRNKGFYPGLHRWAFYILSTHLKPNLTDIFRKEIKKGMVVVDIGANIGFYSILASKLVGSKGKVYAFEPEQKNYNRLVKNLKRNRCRNVVPLNLAVGEKKGELKLYINPDNPSDHCTYDRGHGHTSETITVTSIDAQVQGRVDFIKMDIQGFEESALKGMKETFSRNRHLKLITEFWPYGLKKAGSDPSKTVRLIEEAGFKVYDIGHKGDRFEETDADRLLSEYTGRKETDLFCVK